MKAPASKHGLSWRDACPSTTASPIDDEYIGSTRAIAPSPSPQDYASTLMKIIESSTSTSAMAKTVAASTSHEEDNKWSLVGEVKEPFNAALKQQFPEFSETWKKIWVTKDGADYQCDNVLSIWPKIKKMKSNSNKYKDIKGPKDVGEKIKQGIVNLRSPMIEGEPCVHGVGFVTIKLSGSWMAENIHKMLRDGIDTWAPRQQFDIKSTIVNTPSWDESNLTPMDVLRRQFIIMSRMHMHEYVKSVATTSLGNGRSFPKEKLDDHFKSVEENGKVLIYAKDQGNTKPLIRGNSRKSLGERDRRFGYPLEDLRALWDGLVNEEADWIVCVTPSQQQDYINECFKAAEHAGWIQTGNLWPNATYVGFKTCSTSLEGLLAFVSNAKCPCEAGDAADVLEYTNEAVLDCAVAYTFLKNHRLADCKFNYNEMLDIKGDTFVHLLATQAQIRKITNHSRKDIDELKKASNLGLEGDKVIWSEGVERELGYHLLMFTEKINESYLSFFPHILCGYLYDLSEKFSRFYETYASSGFGEKTSLLLCEATAVVMEKGFHILGITQKPSLDAVSAAKALKNAATLEASNPLENLDIRSRFEVFSVDLHIRDHDFKDGELFGNIQVSDNYGLVPHGWGKLLNPGPGRISLMNHDMHDSIQMENNGRLEIGNPSSRASVPVSSFMRIIIVLYATNKKNDEFYEVCGHASNMNFSDFLEDNSKSISREYFIAKGDDGYMKMHYILLKDAVDATIKVKFGTGSGRKVSGTILAYYDNSDPGKDKFLESFYKASLFESFDGSKVLKDGDVPLTRSILAVPKNGSLVIEAHLDFDSGNESLHGSCVFSSHPEGSFKNDIKDKDSTLEVEITWS